MIRRFLQRWIGTPIYCIGCGERLGRDVLWLGIVSPSKVQADHAPSCPEIIALKARCTAS